jgi:hypothetical protein
MRFAWRWLLVSSLLLAPSAAWPAEILRCLGPDDAVLFTDTACPEGFTIVDRLPARVTPESTACTEADALGPAEVEAALLEATAKLQALRASTKEGEAHASWERCLSLLAARKASLRSAEARRDPETAEAPSPREPIEEICSVGSFETRSLPGGFEVLYTHGSAHACRSVPYYCLWGVFSSAGFYQQSTTGVYRGRVETGQTVAIATIEPRSGPMDREVVWSWCVKR